MTIDAVTGIPVTEEVASVSWGILDAGIPASLLESAMQCPRCNHKLRLTGEALTIPHMDVEIHGAASPEYDPEYHGLGNSCVPTYHCPGCGEMGSYSHISRTDEQRAIDKKRRDDFFARVRETIGERKGWPERREETHPVTG